MHKFDHNHKTYNLNAEPHLKSGVKHSAAIQAGRPTHTLSVIFLHGTHVGEAVNKTVPTDAHNTVLKIKFSRAQSNQQNLISSHRNCVSPEMN